MDNQHRKIKGYRELSEEEIKRMNQIKEMGLELESLVVALGNMGNTDKRWVSEGATDLQKGLMSLTRAVARPTFF